MANDDSSGLGRRTLRFRRRIAPTLADESLVGVARAYDVGPGGHLVTEYVPRVTLEALLRVGSLPHEAALDALRDVADELRVIATDTGEAHGDIKPWNVFVLPDGHVTIADPHARQDTGPEAAPRATRRSDAYWFGVLACQALTGTRPIDRPDAARLMGETGLPDVVRTAVLRTLQPRPQRRPLPHALVAALDAVPDDVWLAGPASDEAGTSEAGTSEEATAGAAAESETRAADPGGPIGPVAPVDGPAPATAVADPADEEGEGEGAAPAASREPREPILPRLLRRLGRYVAAVGVVLVLTSGVAGLRMLGLLEPAAVGSPAAAPLRIQQLGLAVTPPRTHCPRAHVILSATITTNGNPGTVTLHWQLPGGQLLADTQVQVASGEHRITYPTDVTLLGQRALRGAAVATANPGGVRATAPFRFDCGTLG